MSLFFLKLTMKAAVAVWGVASSPGLALLNPVVMLSFPKTKQKVRWTVCRYKDKSSKHLHQFMARDVSCGHRLTKIFLCTEVTEYLEHKNMLVSQAIDRHQGLYYPVELPILLASRDARIKLCIDDVAIDVKDNVQLDEEKLTSMQHAEIRNYLSVVIKERYKILIDQCKTYIQTRVHLAYLDIRFHK